MRELTHVPNVLANNDDNDEKRKNSQKFELFFERNRGRRRSFETFGQPAAGDYTNVQKISSRIFYTRLFGIFEREKKHRGCWDKIHKTVILFIIIMINDHNDQDDHDDHHYHHEDDHHYHDYYDHDHDHDHHDHDHHHSPCSSCRWAMS